MILTIDVNNAWYVIWIFFMEIELHLIKLENRKKRKPYYFKLHHTMYHEICEGHKFAQALQNCRKNCSADSTSF